MNLTAPSEVKKICEENNIRLSKKFGQNFLIDRNVLNKIINASGLKNSDVVLEVGPGLGTLTIELAKHVKKVIAVEIDKRLAGILKQNLAKFDNIEVVIEDILKSQISNPKSPARAGRQIKSKILNIKNQNYKIVANLPYQITSKFIRKFLEAENKPEEMTLMIQKEVAERILAKDQKESLLSISVKYYSEPKILFNVSKNCFFPKPRVDSAVIKIANIRERKDVKADKFFKVVKAGFLHKRRQLAVNLSKELKNQKEEITRILAESGLNPQIRAEDLTLENWLALVCSL